MKSLPLATFAITTLAAALAMPYAPRVEAGTGIQRCQATDGSVVYTDKACGAFGAANTPISGELMTRIAREETLDTSNGTGDGTDTIDTMQAMPRQATARRSINAGCARTPTQLTMDLQGAFAMQDVNRLAESYHWTGMSNTAGQRLMARLESFTKMPLVDAHFFDATIRGGGLEFADASQALDAASSAGGVMQLSFGEGMSRRVVDFDVEKYQGCYFVRF